MNGRRRNRAPAEGRHHRPPGAGEQVEGRQAVMELLKARRRPTRQIFMAAGATASPVLDEIAELAAHAGVTVRSVERDRIDAMARTDAHQGVLALADPLPEVDLEDLLGRSGEEAPFLVVLDGVTDPHNVGAVMRSALSAGSSGLVLARHRAGALTPSAVKAAAGAAEHLPVAVVAGIPAVLSDLAAAGVWTVGLDADAPTSLWDLTVATEAVALVLGSEGRGLGRLVRHRCDVVAAIPMQGPLQSLNVSAAAALACFEVARRRSGPN